MSCLEVKTAAFKRFEEALYLPPLGVACQSVSRIAVAYDDDVLAVRQTCSGNRQRTPEYLLALLEDFVFTQRQVLKKAEKLKPAIA